MTPQRWRQLLVIYTVMYLSVLQNLEGLSWSTPYNWKQYMGIDKYPLLLNKKESYKHCREKGGFLPKPMSEEENNYLKEFTAHEFYLGIHLTPDGRWVYDDDDTPLEWTDWVGIVPKNEGGVNENCVVIGDFGHGRGWYKIPCTKHLWSRVICERKVSPQEPTKDNTVSQASNTQPDPDNTAKPSVPMITSAASEPVNTSVVSVVTQRPSKTHPQDNTADTQCTKCTHTCAVKEGVATCTCFPGFYLSGPVQCIDVDECVQHADICLNNTCVNNNGSYMCECRHGYQNISLQTCIKVNQNTLNVKTRSIFHLKSIEAMAVAIVFSTIATGFFIATAVLCAKTVGQSLYRFVTTEPVEGTIVRGTLHHYVVITRYVEKCKTRLESNVPNEEERSIQQGVLSAKDSISPNGSDIPLDSINGSIDRWSVISKSVKPSRSGSHLPSKACSADPSVINMQ